ncbi:MAG: hypothetical protein Kow00127_09920 [Bacteroidales bacterium]
MAGYLKKWVGAIPVLMMLILILIWSCNRDRPSPSWDVDILAPLATDTLTLYDVIDESFFRVNGDQSVSLYFNEELYKVNIDSLVRLPDTLFNWGFSLEGLPNPIQLSPGDTIIREVFDWPLDIASFDIEDVALKEVLIRSGDVRFEAFSGAQTDLLVVFGINSAVRNQTDTFRVAEKVLQDVVFESTHDVGQYHIDLTGSNHDTVNMLNYYMALIVHPDETGPVTLNPGDTFSVNIYFEEILLD